MTETTNILGLDKFQTTIIKRNYLNVKPLITKRDKALAKISEVLKKQQEIIDNLQQEATMYMEQIAALDKFTTDITEKATGYALTSEQCVNFLNNPDEWTKFRQEHEGIFASKEQTVNDLDAEEDADWENRIRSGEIKEAV